ncbi:MAG: DUF4013 domain-containing protein [Methanobrevibacter sp.]|uniref:DUF4013 domain-containing protein n=1 Tax=Methanobrevibacter sp. TaxID=66852 RepID=UPI0025D00FAA|nr:DUF4013 domain-containing protein [Methanobrevibacter sp.]MBQ8017867.1 DUF4013 domain-containing protein [Methanobrevibacter sp.]
MIFDILTDSVRYAISKPKTILILGVFNLFDFLVVPLLFALGYYYKITKESTRGMINCDEKMPPLNNFKQLFIDGVKVLSAGLIYLIPPFVVFISLLFLSELGYLEYDLVDPLSNCIFFIFFCYFYIALPNMAYHDSFKKAFDFKQINRIIIKKIGVLPLIIVLLAINFMEYIFGSISADIVQILNIIFSLDAVSLHALTFVFGTVMIALFITPFIDVLLSRATGLLYVSDD